MPGLTNFASKAALDLEFPTTGGTSYVAYSTNGTTEFGGLARTAVGATGWAAATSADPSVKANSAILTSAAASSAGTVTHYGIFDASTAGNQLVDWTAMTASKTLAIGDQLVAAIGAVAITLT